MIRAYFQKLGGLGHRAVLLLTLVMAAVPVLSGCHGSKGMSVFTLPEEFDASGEYEITFWAKNDTNKTQTDIYQKAISDFEDLYPNITVNLRLYTDYGKIYNDVITNIATGTTPNVCITYPDLGRITLHTPLGLGVSRDRCYVAPFARTSPRGFTSPRRS